jgi:integrase
METNKEDKKSNTSQTPTVKWTDKAIFNLTWPKSKGSPTKRTRVRVKLEGNPGAHLRGVYINWQPITNKKSVYLDYKLKGEKKNGTMVLGELIPKVKATQYYTNKLIDLSNSHKDGDGHWISNPNEKKVSKQFILKTQRKTIREVIRMIVEAQFPRKNAVGFIDYQTARSYARILMGYNQRFQHLSFTNNTKGWGQVKLITDKKIKTYGDLWKTYQPGENIETNKWRNRKDEISVYDSDLGGLEIDDLTSGIIERFIHQKDRTEGVRLNILKAFQCLWGFAHRKRLMGDTSPLDPTRRKYGGVTIVQDETTNTKNTQYNDLAFTLDQVRRIEKELVSYGKKKPFIAEVLQWILYTGMRKSDACKLKWENIHNFNDRKKAYIIHKREDQKGRASKKTKDEKFPITFLMRRVIVQRKKYPKYQWIPFLFPSGQINWDKVNDPINYPDHKYSDECRVSERTLNDHFNKVRDKLGIQGSIRTLRKTKDTWGIDKIGEQKMMTVMARKSIEVQRRNYNKPVDERKQKWANEGAQIYQFKNN